MPPEGSREWYAGLAMQALITSGRVNIVSEDSVRRLAKVCFLVADQMLAEAAATPEEPPA